MQKWAAMTLLWLSANAHAMLLQTASFKDPVAAGSGVTQTAPVLIGYPGIPLQISQVYRFDGDNNLSSTAGTISLGINYGFYGGMATRLDNGVINFDPGWFFIPAALSISQDSNMHTNFQYTFGMGFKSIGLFGGLDIPQGWKPFLGISGSFSFDTLNRSMLWDVAGDLDRNFKKSDE